MCVLKEREDSWTKDNMEIDEAIDRFVAKYKALLYYVTLNYLIAEKNKWKRQA